MPPTLPPSFDELLAQAAHFAEFSMREMGRLPPSLFLLTAEGQLLLFVPKSLNGEADKDDFATTARLICIAHGATACVLALEAWMTSARDGEKLDMTEPPSESLHRREVVVLLGEARGEAQRHQFLPIVRHDNGKFFNLAPEESSGLNETDQMKGRFAQILPPKAPDAALREVAKAMLKVKGVAAAKPAKKTRPPRGRG